MKIELTQAQLSLILIGLQCRIERLEQWRKEADKDIGICYSETQFREITNECRSLIADLKRHEIRPWS